MSYEIKQISPLEKIKSNEKALFDEIYKVKALKGERVSYQIALLSDERMIADISVSSPFGEGVKLYREREVFVDMPITEPEAADDEDYLTKEQTFLPDVLVPLGYENNKMIFSEKNAILWVRVDVPGDMPCGVHKVAINFEIRKLSNKIVESVMETKEFEIEVVSTKMPQQKLIYTRWFYADCIASAHNVEIYSEEHWALIEKYIAAAVDSGVNMILTPVHTPPLDTEIGAARPCVQLVDIEKKGDKYEFSFEKFHRFISICKKCGIKYYEIAHMFSQWGAKHAPNIEVSENGVKSRMFGWHTDSESDEYINFLKQYITAISKELEAEGIAENTYFHISDEPVVEDMEKYAATRNIIKPLVGNSKIFDALSHIEFYEKGLVECPVTIVNSIHEFLKHNIENQWVYYCCGPQSVYTNSILAMPLSRIRILGFLIYKYNIKGFLHWGFNFYNASCSRYNINPYLTTSADGAFPSGDGYIVYPEKDRVYSSMRGEATFMAIEDMNVCLALEEKIGRDAVIKMIDKAAGRDLRFDDYPKGKEFPEKLRSEMIEKLS